MTRNIYICAHMTYVCYIHSQSCYGTCCKQDSCCCSLTSHLLCKTLSGCMAKDLGIQVQLQMRDVLGCSTVPRFQVVLCATVVSQLGPLLSICATLPIIWRDLGSENARVARVVETGVGLFHNVLLVSYFIHALDVCCLMYVG